MRFGGILSAAALVAATATPALAQGNGGGNGAPSGSHYNLNIIGVEKGKTGSLAGSNRHTIFVWLGRGGGISSKIYLSPGDEFKVCDGNATDALTYGCDGSVAKVSGAVFQLPCNTNIVGDGSELVPCSDNTAQLAYNVFARALGAPGGSATITTCAQETVDKDNDGTLDIECSTESAVLIRDPGRSRFANVTQALTSLNLCYVNDLGVEECVRYALFSDGFEDWFWDYANNGLRLAQLRFYPVE